MRVLVTGASGFVGGAVVERLACNSVFFLRAASRRGDCFFSDGVERVVVGSLDADTEWQVALDGVDVVVHAAARAHVMSDTAADPLEEFRRVNVAGTLSLARQAALAGVKRFVFLSSIGVNGNCTPQGQPFMADDAPNPQEPYAVSKLEAEQGLQMLAAETGIDIVIIRPPLVYGPGAPGNWRQLMRVIALGVPLPLGAIHNLRSFVGLDNLVDLIVTCLDHPAAANQVLLVGDGEDVSTTELLRRVGRAMGKPARLIPVPSLLLQASAALLGRRDMAQRLCGSLQVDISKARILLGWKPPVSVDESLAKTARHFLDSQSKNKGLP